MDGWLTAERLGQLIDRHAAALKLYARQWCGSPEDVVQEALMQLVAQRKPPDRLVPWLYRVVRNGAISAARKAQRRRRHEAAAGGGRGWFVPSVEDALDAQAAAQALKALPVEQREAIVARIWGGLTFEEIGELAGCGSSTAHRRYVAGLDGLRERLGVSCTSRDHKAK
jgi:RNA polymerase sigma factor (sigma-70 family)